MYSSRNELWPNTMEYVLSGGQNMCIEVLWGLDREWKTKFQHIFLYVAEFPSIAKNRLTVTYALSNMKHDKA